jgi:hypothetical protein
MKAIESDLADVYGAAVGVRDAERRRCSSVCCAEGADLFVRRRVGHGFRATRGDDRWRRKLLAMTYAALAIAGICVVGAEERGIVGAIGPMAFHIPAQPLAIALQAYGQRAGVQVLYESDSALGRTSTAVEGDFTPYAALNLLLTGTDLRVSYVRSDSVTLAPSSAAGDEPPPTALAAADLSLGTLRVHGPGDSDDALRLHDYGESVKADIQNALQKDAKTRAGNYSAVLGLWIDPPRTIRQIDLLQSTGDRERDAGVAAALRGLATTRPAPTNLPQPIRVAIVVRSLQ